MELKDKIAIITGGASGLGRATADVLASRGVKVALFDLNADAGEIAISEIGSDQAMFLSVDVTDAEAVELAVAAVVEHFGAVHIGVNNAGIGAIEKVIGEEGDPMSLEDFSSVINTNLNGTFNVIRCVAAAMARNTSSHEGAERGVIVNNASVAAFDGQSGWSAYAASKAGVVGMTLPLARDLAPLGIRVNTIAPGLMDTPLLQAMPDVAKDAMTSYVQFPKRLGLSEEFGRLVAHIAENAYINAETIRLDGGVRLPAF